MSNVSESWKDGNVFTKQLELNLKEFEITGKKWYHNFDGHGV